MAVINRTERLFKSIRRLQGTIWIFLTFVAGAAADPVGCDLAKKDVVASGFPTINLLNRPINGPFCGDESCCDSILEQEMMQQSRLNVEIFLRDSIYKLSSLIDNRARKFDTFFKEMLNNSKREFHNMFQKTYGKIYLQNSEVFSDFFLELETYYKKGTNRLSDTMETFFGILYQRMFTVINSQYTFDDKYLECVAEHMAEMNPFGDIPHKLGMQLKRSFVATRTYYKALSLAAEVARKMLALKLDDDCGKDLLKMEYCGRCKGRQGAGACSDYCATVLGACLGAHVAFNSDWNNFIEALDKVADRLVGPFNIEIVVEPLNIKISEAIMNFQEAGTDVSKRIYSLCGKPALARGKRKANFKDSTEDNPNLEIKYEPMKLHKKKKTKKVEENEDVLTLEKLIKEIKAKVRETRQFWLQLPYQYCNNQTVAASPSDSNRCWNGSGTTDYDAAPKIKTLKSSPVINENQYVLQTFSDKLRKAHQGDDVEIVDDTDEGLDVDGSGSGSGDGSSIEEEEQEKENNIHTTNNNQDIVVDKEYPKENNLDIDHPPENGGEDTKNYINSAHSISLSEALTKYLIPIVLVWFGDAISEFL